MSPKRLLLLLVLISLSFWAGAQDKSYTECLVKASSKWGAPCEKCEIYKDGYKRDFSGTYQVELKNTCTELIEVKVAMQEKSGQWRTFPIKALAPQEHMNAFACTGTGKYMYWVRRVNDTEIIIPSDQEIISEYRSR